MSPPKGLRAEYDMERMEWIAAGPGTSDVWQVRLSGGPNDAATWQMSTLPDLIVAKDGAYHPTLTTLNDGIYVWMPRRSPLDPYPA